MRHSLPHGLQQGIAMTRTRSDHSEARRACKLPRPECNAMQNSYPGSMSPSPSMSSSPHLSIFYGSIQSQYHQGQSLVCSWPKLRFICPMPLTYSRFELRNPGNLGAWILCAMLRLFLYRFFFSHLMNKHRTMTSPAQWRWAVEFVPGPLLIYRLCRPSPAVGLPDSISALYSSALNGLGC